MHNELIRQAAILNFFRFHPVRRLQQGGAMSEKYSHCSYCGSRFAATEPWPRTCRSCGNKTYRNPLPVVVVLLPVNNGLVVIRRNIEPSKGTLTLPGGYIDPGESWQEGARRELLEETGIDIDARNIRLYEVMNGLDDTLVIFGLAANNPDVRVSSSPSARKRPRRWC
jgi:ADP-ribose pyrophosphatase YjhB (NUDIX family)